MTSERKPNNWFMALAWLLMIVLAWLLWWPAGAVIAIFALGNLRKVVIANSLVWEAPRYAAGFGYCVGCAIALLIQMLARFVFASLWFRFDLTLFGLAPILYMGYGIARQPSQTNLADSYRLIAEGSALFLILSSRLSFLLSCSSFVKDI